MNRTIETEKWCNWTTEHLKSGGESGGLASLADSEATSKTSVIEEESLENPYADGISNSRKRD